MEDVSKADEIFLFFLKLDVHGSYEFNSGNDKVGELE